MIAVCPGWAKTKIVPNGPIGKALGNLAVPEEVTPLVFFRAMFDSQVPGGAYLATAAVPWTQSWWFPSLTATLTSFFGVGTKVRYCLVDLLILAFTIFQVDYHSTTNGIGNGGMGFLLQSSPKSKDPELATPFYDWIIAELARKGYLSSSTRTTSTTSTTSSAH